MRLICTLWLLSQLALPSWAYFIPFDNCLPPEIVALTEPQRLQFVPLYLNASIDSSTEKHTLNVTVLGNVTGVARQIPQPSAGDPKLSNPNNTDGKIPDLAGDPGQEKYTTFTNQFSVLDYNVWTGEPKRFCNSSVISPCPWAPVSNFTGNSSNVRPLLGASGNGNDGHMLPAMTVDRDLYSSYAFTSIHTILRLKSGDTGGQPIACVEARVTPDFGKRLSDTLTYVPLAILILVAIATACAAIYSPWGSTDVFRFTSNYGRDDDLLRLVTPGFGDCLQYIQFIVLAGSLSLDYPGFFQPAVSQVGWSSLMFNESFVSHGPGYQAVVDGIYVVNATYGMDRMSQLIGMTQDKDIWAGMMIWLLVIIAAIVTLIQIAFFVHWLYRIASNTRQEDLRQKNLPFSAGNAIRIVFNYFLLPIVALSCYQLVIASRSPGSVVGVAAIVIVLLICFAGYLLWLIASTRPRSYLFDDLPTVLLYGPLYNTYSDNAATFALVPVMLTFLRGIAIGAVQPSGIAQLVLLAICEVITILTLNAFRPFHSPTSMNAFHTFFAVMRLLTVLLSVAFLPSLGVRDAPKGWIGYIVLLLHALVLVFGFSLNALQTFIEVIARLAGAGGEDGTATRGGLVRVFGMRQLSRRHPRKQDHERRSIASDAAMLAPDGDQKSSQWNETRSRSVSASSAILLNKQGRDNRQSLGLESTSAAGPGDTPISGGASAFSYIPGGSQAAGHSGGGGGGGGGGIVNIRNAAATDPYYRPPRPRRTTMEALQPQVSDRDSALRTDADRANGRLSRQSPDVDASPMRRDSPLISRRGTPIPTQLGGNRERSDSDADDPRTSKTDYATREVDFYYGVRGPALSNQPTRRLKTGPADPTGPVSSASGWLKGLFGGKTKEKGKGFEVVRSSRVPPFSHRTASGSVIATDELPYTDEPGAPQVERSRDLALSDEGDAIGGGTRHLPDSESSPAVSDLGSDVGSMTEDDWAANRASQISTLPPSLPAIDSSGGIELPSRVGSRTSARNFSRGSQKRRLAPNVPRKSSKRDSSADPDKYQTRLSTVQQSPASTPQRTTRVYDAADVPPGANPQGGAESSPRLPFATHKKSFSEGTHLSTGESVLTSSFYPPSRQAEQEEAPGHARHSSSVLGAHDLDFERPTSIGYVNQHRASDNIHTAQSSFLGSSAELFNAPSRRSISPEIGAAK